MKFKPPFALNVDFRQKKLSVVNPDFVFIGFTPLNTYVAANFQLAVRT